MKKPHYIAPEIKEQILKRIKEEGVPVAQVAKCTYCKCKKIWVDGCEFTPV